MPQTLIASLSYLHIDHMDLHQIISLPKLTLFSFAKPTTLPQPKFLIFFWFPVININHTINILKISSTILTAAIHLIHYLQVCTFSAFVNNIDFSTFLNSCICCFTASFILLSAYFSCSNNFPLFTTFIIFLALSSLFKINYYMFILEIPSIYFHF